MTGVNESLPSGPRFETVNVPPSNVLIEYSPARTRSVSRRRSRVISASDFEPTSSSTGVTSPWSISTATPMLCSS
jgi:hypothetical protein